MLAFLLAHWIIICVAGIIVNVIVFMDAVSDQPEGAMGTAIIMPFLLIPYFIAVIMLLGKIGEMLGKK